jgi:hypothetical protein
MVDTLSSSKWWKKRKSSHDHVTFYRKLPKVQFRFLEEILLYIISRDPKLL